MILIFVMQAISRLLVNYPQKKQRDEILDYLFKVRYSSIANTSVFKYDLC